MGSSDSQNRARMVAQARLVEAYERAQWPRTAPALPVLLNYLMDQHGLSRADLDGFDDAAFGYRLPWRVKPFIHVSELTPRTLLTS